MTRTSAACKKILRSSSTRLLVPSDSSSESTVGASWSADFFISEMSVAPRFRLLHEKGRVDENVEKYLQNSLKVKK